MRIGHGYDTHPLIAHRKLILGGVHVPFNFGLAGHSDGDVVIHALCDALLGAAGLSDIGHFFPENDNKFKNIDSRILLRDVAEKLKEKEGSLENADLTILAEAPKLATYFPQMKTYLADDLAVFETQINIKASTTEKMGFIGRSEGIAAYAVVLIS